MAFIRHSKAFFESLIFAAFDFETIIIGRNRSRATGAHGGSRNRIAHAIDCCTLQCGVVMSG
jgi:hypothetical protein